MQSPHTRIDHSPGIDARSTLDSLPDYLAVLDADRVVFYVNENWQTFPMPDKTLKSLQPI